MIPLRRILPNVRQIASLRAMSSSGPLINTQVDNEGIAIVTMQRPPVNSLNLDLLQDLSKTLDEVAKNKCKGMILTSSSPTVFSAGLDIMEIYKPDMKRVETFYTTLQEVWIKLFGSNFITAAAINRAHGICDDDHIAEELQHLKKVLKANKLQVLRCDHRSRVKHATVERLPAVLPYIKGVNDKIGYILRKASIKTYFKRMSRGHAPAGGCLLSMSCEYRVMVNGKYTIGFNETALGIVVPTWFMHTITNTISKRDAEFALTTARMFNVEKALKVALIDETASDKADSVEKCKKFIKKFDRIPPLARSITKQKIRAEPLTWMQKNRASDLQEFIGFVQSPKVQKSLEMYIQSLKQHSAK